MDRSAFRLAVFGIVFLVILGTVLGSLQPREAIPALFGSPESLDLPEAKAIIATLERAYLLEAQAARTFDIDQFPDVFINTDDFRPTGRMHVVIREIFGREAMLHAGYLTFMQAHYLSWKEGARILHSEEWAKKTNQEQVEFMQLHPGIMLGNLRLDPIGKLTIVIEKIVVQGDKAVVRYDTPSLKHEATMVKVEGRWYIANDKTLQVHVELRPTGLPVGVL